MPIIGMTVMVIPEEVREVTSVAAMTSLAASIHFACKGDDTRFASGSAVGLTVSAWKRLGKALCLKRR